MHQRFWKHIISFFLLLIFVFTFSSCLFIPNFAQTLFLGGSADLSDSEEGMFDSGPIDLPVTIAKLDSPDTDLIDVEVGASDTLQSILPVEEAEKEDLRFQTSESFPFAMKITGQAGSVSPSATPFIIAYYIESDGISVNQESRRVASVQSDGSFSLTIGVPTIDTQVVFFAVDLTQLLSSPFISAVRDEQTGTYILVTTNSEIINANQSLVVDENGYYYLSLLYGDGSTSFVRRNKNGSLPEDLIFSNVEVQQTATYGHRVSITDADGVLDLIVPTTTVSTLVKSHPMFDIVAFIDEVTTLSNYSKDLTRLFMMDDGLFVSQFGDTVNIDFYRYTSGLKTKVLKGEYKDAKVALSPESETLYAAADEKGDGSGYALYSVDVSGSLGLAWQKRTKIADLTFDAVPFIDVSFDDTVVMDVDEAGVRNLYYWNTINGFVQVNDDQTDLNEYVNPRISSNGKYIFACQLDAAGDAHQLVYHEIGVNNLGEFNGLTSDEKFQTCSEIDGSYFIDSKNVLHFYRKHLETGIAQHAMIKMSQFEE